MGTESSPPSLKKPSVWKKIGLGIVSVFVAVITAGTGDEKNESSICRLEPSQYPKTSRHYWCSYA